MAVELSLHEMSTMDQIKALKEGRIDVGFGRIRHEDPSVRRVVLREERMIGAAGRACADRRKAGAVAARPRERHADHLPKRRDRAMPTRCSRRSTIAAQPRRIYERANCRSRWDSSRLAKGFDRADSVYGLKRDDVSYKDLDDKQLVSPSS
jgi:DNA-binding transcriptional LysR family regulator